MVLLLLIIIIIILLPAASVLVVRPAHWPLQDIVLLRGFCARINHPSLPSPTCIARTNAILLHVYCAIYDALPTPLLYAIHHTILIMAISCKGQPVQPAPVSHAQSLPIIVRQLLVQLIRIETRIEIRRRRSSTAVRAQSYRRIHPAISEIWMFA